VLYLEFIGSKLYWIVHLVAPKASKESLKFICIAVITIRLVRLKYFS
jgi:hypothetical protein